MCGGQEAPRVPTPATTPITLSGGLGAAVPVPSGWVSDPAAVTIRFRPPRGRVEENTVQNGVAILIYETAFDRESVVEILDDAGNVLQSARLA
jgi:hypothetical protein